MTSQSKVFLISLFSLMYLAITYFILDSDTLIFGDSHQSPEEIEAVSGSMNFQDLE